MSVWENLKHLKGLNVVNLFAGMEVGRLACERAGVPIDKYYSSEIDKYAIQVSKANWPDIIHLGDVTKVYGCTLPDIHLLLGGSPCQDLRPGRDGLKGSKSKLFYEYVRVKKELQEYNPEIYFLFENTYKMSESDKKIISEILGVDSVYINSALLGPQNRRRLYWTNIPFLGQPTDTNENLVDVLLDEVSLKYLVTEKAFARSITRRRSFRVSINPIKTHTLNTKNNSGQAALDPGTTYISCIQNELKLITDFNQFNKTAEYNGGGPYRRLTPIECARLQKVPDHYINEMSDTQAYRMLGNGWHADTIAHLLNPLGDYRFLY